MVAHCYLSSYEARNKLMWKERVFLKLFRREKKFAAAWAREVWIFREGKGKSERSVVYRISSAPS